jgi:uncharacterized protein with HEPN domain
MKKDDTVYLQHVLDAINTIEEYLQGITEDKSKSMCHPSGWSNSTN